MREYQPIKPLYGTNSNASRPNTVLSSFSKEASGPGASFTTVLEDQGARIRCGAAYVELHAQLGVELVIESPLSRNITVPELTRHCSLQPHM